MHRTHAISRDFAYADLRAGASVHSLQLSSHLRGLHVTRAQSKKTDASVFSEHSIPRRSKVLSKHALVGQELPTLVQNRQADEQLDIVLQDEGILPACVL